MMIIVLYGEDIFIQIFGLWIRAMIYTYPFNVIQVKPTLLKSKVIIIPLFFLSG